MFAIIQAKSTCYDHCDGMKKFITELNIFAIFAGMSLLHELYNEI